VSAPGDAPAAVVRGGLLLMAAKLAHIVAGSGIWFFLADIMTRRMGDAGTAAYGVYGTTLDAVINPLNMMLAQGTLQLVSRLVASHPGQVDAVFRRCLAIVVPASLVFLVLFELAAPLVARWQFRDESYATYLRLGGLIPVFYAVRCVYQGYCNGAKRFREQSWIDMGSSTLRMVLVLAGAVLGFGALGALGGFVAAAAVMMVVAMVWIRPGPAAAADEIPVRHVLGFLVKVLALTLVTYYLLGLDQRMVKVAAHADPDVADRWAGYFLGNRKIAQIPWGVVVGLAWVIFPLMAESSTASAERRADVVRQGMRVVLLLLVPIAAILASNADETYRLVFPGPSATADRLGDPASVVSAPLAILAVGYTVYGLLILATMILTAGGRPGLSLLLLSGTLAVAWPLTERLASSHGPAGAAAGLSIAWGAGLLGAVVVLVRRYGTFVAPARLVRIVACGLLVWAAGRALPTSGLLLLAEDAGLALLFLGLVLATREVAPAELGRVVSAVLGRRR